jgi:lipid-A-disaccharide synthase
LNKIFIIAGESSGDILGADLMRALLSMDGGVRFYGVGGEEMAKIPGFKPLFDIRDIAVMGIFEVLRKIFTIRKRLRRTVSEILRIRPDMVITVDSPGFNMRVAAMVRKCLPSVKIAHYVAPSVWAWKESRAKKIAGLYDYLFCFFPFERKYFERFGLKTFVVGHTAVANADGDGKRFLESHGLAKSDFVLALLPGSRVQMAARLLPVFEKTIPLLARKIPNLKVFIPATAISRDLIRVQTRNWAVRPVIIEGRGARGDLFRASRAAISISGTAVLELALAGVPTVVAYRVSPLTYFIASRLVKIPYVSLPNIILGRRAVPEFIQGDCTPENLSRTIVKFADDKARLKKYSHDMRVMREKLAFGKRGETPSQTAAKIISGILKGP